MCLLNKLKRTCGSLKVQTLGGHLRGRVYMYIFDSHGRRSWLLNYNVSTLCAFEWSLTMRHAADTVCDIPPLSLAGCWWGIVSLMILVSAMSIVPSNMPLTSSRARYIIERTQRSTGCWSYPYNNFIFELVRFLRQQHKIGIPRGDSEAEDWPASVINTLKESVLVVVWLPSIWYMSPWISIV